MMPSSRRVTACSAAPETSFDGVHLASLEWDVDEVARFLDRFPTARVDMAARLVHLEYQSVAQARRYGASC